MVSITSSAEALFSLIYCGDSALTIVLFDWLLCLNEEVVCIWKTAGGLNAGSVVYALNRFPLMVGLVFNIVATLPLSLLSCHIVFWVNSICILISRVSIVLFSAFRVYAISGRRVIPTLVVTLLSTISIIISLVIYSGFETGKVLPSPFNCSNNIMLSSQWAFRYIVISRTSLTAADALVIIITWRNRIYWLRRGHLRGETLGRILLRDGTVYFIILALLNMLHIILTTASVSNFRTSDPFWLKYRHRQLDTIDKLSHVTIFLDPLSSILTCRFILNLRQVEHSGMFSTMSSGEDVQFATQDSGSTLPRSITSFGELIHTGFSGTEVEEGAEVEDAGEDSAITHGSSSMQDTVHISV